MMEDFPTPAPPITTILNSTSGITSFALLLKAFPPCDDDDGEVAEDFDETLPEGLDEVESISSAARLADALVLSSFGAGDGEKREPKKGIENFATTMNDRTC